VRLFAAIPKMSSSRDQILSRVRDALAPLPSRTPLPEWDASLVRLRNSTTPADLWAPFAERLRSVNGTPLASPLALISFLTENNLLRGYCDPALHASLASHFPPTITLSTELDRSRIDDYQFGLTAAFGAIAETGTIILSDNTTSSRLGALAPWVHIAALRRDQIFPDIPSAIAALPADPNIIWVTGPSKTADVEGILIEGVHGPGLQAALLL